MSLQTIRAGLITTLTACGPYSACEISACDFGILSGVSSCALIFSPGANTRIEPDRFGATLNRRNYHRSWSLAGHVFVKHTGDPTTLITRVWQAHDDLFDTLTKDDSLNGSCQAATLTGFAWNENQAVEAWGQVWADVQWEVVAEEF